MVVIILEKVPASVRGKLTRWMLELRAGIFVGNVSAMVRERLWEMVRAKVGKRGGGLLIHTTASEQGYAISCCGHTSKTVADFDGLFLMLTV